MEQKYNLENKSLKEKIRNYKIFSEKFAEYIEKCMGITISQRGKTNMLNLWHVSALIDYYLDSGLLEKQLVLNSLKELNTATADKNLEEIRKIVSDIVRGISKKDDQESFLLNSLKAIDDSNEMDFYARYREGVCFGWAISHVLDLKDDDRLKVKLFLGKIGSAANFLDDVADRKSDGRSRIEALRRFVAFGKQLSKAGKYTKGRFAPLKELFTLIRDFESAKNRDFLQV